MYTDKKSIEAVTKLLPIFASAEGLNVYFDYSPSQDRIEFQASDQKTLHKITSLFPGVIWKKTFNSTMKWWEYVGTYQGLQMQVYAVREAPPTCQPIYRTVKVKKQVPVIFEEQEVEETVIDGYDCGGEPEANHDSQSAK